MKICYVLLSPTFGMHQYTADLADGALAAGFEVTLVTTKGALLDRYAAGVRVEMPAATTGTGMEAYSLRLDVLRRLGRAVLGTGADVVHFAGPHLWNPLLLRRLRRVGIPTIHSLHDLDPHSGTSRLLYLWNRAVLRGADVIMVHGERYRERLLAQGMAPERVVALPLLHLFLGAKMRTGLGAEAVASAPIVLFFGRLAEYKGVGDLLAAWALLAERGLRGDYRLVLAGNGTLPAAWQNRALPAGVEVRNRLIGDEEALDMFRRCCLLVLPYRDATQSALVGAAYYFGKPVLATRTGALPEYVLVEETGWLIEPGDSALLAAALGHALADRERLVTMGMAGRSWYNVRRVWERAALQSLYENVGRQSRAKR